MFWGIFIMAGIEAQDKHIHKHLRVDVRLRLMFLVIGISIMLALRPWIAKQTYNRGVIFYNAGNYKKAVKYFKKAIFLAPAYGCANLFLASTYEEMGDYQDAIKIYTSYIRVVPHNPQTYYFLGSLYASRYKNYIKALGWFDTAISVDKKYWQAYLWRGICWQVLGRLDLALQNYRQMAKVFPHDERVKGFIKDIQKQIRNKIR